MLSQNQVVKHGDKIVEPTQPIKEDIPLMAGF